MPMTPPWGECTGRRPSELVATALVAKQVAGATVAGEPTTPWGFGAPRPRMGIGQGLGQGKFLGLVGQALSTPGRPVVRGALLGLNPVHGAVLVAALVHRAWVGLGAGARTGPLAACRLDPCGPPCCRFQWRAPKCWPRHWPRLPPPCYPGVLLVLLGCGRVQVARG